jgi:hypothetical protein
MTLWRDLLRADRLAVCHRQRLVEQVAPIRGACLAALPAEKILAGVARSDGNPNNDGASWHSHWVVLVEDKACAGGLKVRDISPGQDVLPPTAPGLPIALDSPGMSPILKGSTVTITVPVQGAENVNFDAVAAKLQVHA